MMTFSLSKLCKQLMIVQLHFVVMTDENSSAAAIDKVQKRSSESMTMKVTYTAVLCLQMEAYLKTIQEGQALCCQRKAASHPCLLTHQLLHYLASYFWHFPLCSISLQHFRFRALQETSI